jgi:TolB protein
MKLPRLLHLVALSAGLSGSVFPLFAKAASPVGQFADHGDIGAPEIAGSTTYDPTLQHYRMTGSGINLWGPSDQFQFAWNKLKGDFIVRARFEFVGQGVDPHRKFCLC